MHAALRISSLLLFALPWAPMAACLLGDDYDSLNSPVRIELLEEIDEVRELVESEEHSEDGLACSAYNSVVGSDSDFIKSNSYVPSGSARIRQNPTRGPPLFKRSV